MGNCFGCGSRFARSAAASASPNISPAPPNFSSISPAAPATFPAHSTDFPPTEHTATIPQVMVCTGETLRIDTGEEGIEMKEIKEIYG